MVGGGGGVYIAHSSYDLTTTSPYSNTMKTQMIYAMQTTYIKKKKKTGTEKAAVYPQKIGRDRVIVNLTIGRDRVTVNLTNTQTVSFGNTWEAGWSAWALSDRSNTTEK